MSEIQEKIRARLSQLRDPENGRELNKSNQIESIEVEGNQVRCTIRLTTHSWPIKDEFSEKVEESIRSAYPEAGSVTVQIEPLDRPPVAIGQIGLQARNVIAVGSGKG